jgi:F-type H+-transporting ATPase subunit a
MGDHDTWYTLLDPEFWARLEGNHPESFGLKEELGREWTWMMFAGTHFTLVHVVAALLSCLLILIAVWRWRKSIQDETKGVVPPPTWGLAAMLDGFVRASFKYTADTMGDAEARKYLPFIGTLALLIFLCNMQALIPGFLSGTDTLKTNLALAAIVFVLYNVMGAIKQGPINYALHFMGPSFELGGIKLPWLAPLMLPVEIASHISRPVSLSVRLMGNMIADHKVVLAMVGIFPILLPVPFLMLGTLVVIVQTLVFTLLTIVYIATAIEHAEH